MANNLKNQSPPSNKNRPNPSDLSIWKNLQYDIPSGLVVFLVALPLCLGIALASQGSVDGAPIFSGLLAGIIGGLVIPLISRAPLSVSGPAAGLIAIVITGIDSLGSWEAFLLATFIGGLVQIALWMTRAGAIAYFFPSAVIKGMLAAIGLILIRKQIPHALGLDLEQVDLSFHLTDTWDVFSEILIEKHYEPGAIIISLISLTLLIVWDRTPLRKLRFLPGALAVVLIGALINLLYGSFAPQWILQGGEGGHLVFFPQDMDGVSGFFAQLQFPDWSAVTKGATWVTGITIGLVASVETLLSCEAVDKLDPHKRSTPLSRELLAQGVANSIAGLIGALPITAVIVRSSANVDSGGQTRMSAFVHGVFLLVAVMFGASLISLIPLASLAAVLLVVGYKLTRPELYKKMYADGITQFLPFIVTIISVLVFDLLIGILIGTVVGLFFIIQANFRTAINIKKEGDSYLISFDKDVSFLNKAILRSYLDRIPADSHVIIDLSGAEFIDHDIKELVQEYMIHADEEDIEITFRGEHPIPEFIKDSPLPGKLKDNVIRIE